jgi:D-alanine-D-alanine ligase
VPALIEDSLRSQIHALATEVARLVGIRGIARIDFLLDDGQLYVNEVNNPPGSLARYLWVEPAIAFVDLLQDMETEALRKPARRFGSTGADGFVLRSAGSIAAKLA